MALGSDTKQTIIQKFSTQQGDTGSAEVQVALLTAKIQKLISHLEGNKNDKHSRKGLLSMVSKRRRLLYYLMNKDLERYQALINQLGLSK